MIACEVCSSPLAADDAYCANCGAAAPLRPSVGMAPAAAQSVPTTCPACGVLVHGEPFCGSCGTDLRVASRPSQLPAASVPPHGGAVVAARAQQAGVAAPKARALSGVAARIGAARRGWAARAASADVAANVARLLMPMAAVLSVLGGVLLVAQLGLRWIVDGNGSTFTGQELAGQLMYGRARPAWGPVGGILVFLAAMLGAWSVATSSIRDRLVGISRLVVGLLVAVVLGVLALSGTFEFSAWAIGPRLLLLGAISLAVSGVLQAALARSARVGVTRRPFTIAAVASGVAAAGLVVFLLVGASAGSEEGEPTPELAVQRFVDALDASDLFAATTIISSSEAGGIEVALRELEAALRGSPAVGGAPVSIDVTVSAGRLSSRELATGVAEVTTDVSLSATVAGLGEGVLGPVNDLGGVQVEDFGVITVFENGGWWVSPMLTAGNYLSTALDLPEGEYRRVQSMDELGVVPASAAQDAVDAIAGGLSDANPMAVSEGLDPGARRLVAVFEDAVQQLMDEFDSEFGISIDDATLDQSETGGYSMAELSARAENYEGYSRELWVDGECSIESPDVLCLLDGLPLTSSLSADQLPIVFTDGGDESTVQVLATAVRWASVVAPRIDPTIAAEVLDTEDRVASDPLQAGEAKEVSLGSGVAFRNLSLPTTPNEPFTLSMIGDEGMYAEVYSAGPDGEEYVTSVYATPEGGGGTVYPNIITAPSASLTLRVFNAVSCSSSRLFRCSPTGGSSSIAVERVGTLDIVPDDAAGADLAPGEVLIVRFTASGDGRYKLTSDSPDLAVYRYDEASQALEEELGAFGGQSYQFVSGERVALALVNVSTTTGLFDLEIEEDPLPQGFLVNGRTVSQVTVDLSNGGRYVQVYFRPGDRVEIVAVPNDNQDITLDGDCYGCNYVDIGYSGDSETLVFFGDDSLSASIYVAGWSYYNDYGPVTLYVYIS